MYWPHGSDYAEAMRGIYLAGDVAQQSLCLRAKCGAVIISKDGNELGEGYNAPPQDCPISVCRKETLAPSFKSDRTCCIHAEANAVYDALRIDPAALAGSTLYFTRLGPDGLVQPSGDPYCSMCSKLALHMGIARFVLYHIDGIAIYRANEYNELTFAYGKSRLA